MTEGEVTTANSTRGRKSKGSVARQKSNVIYITGLA